MGLPVFPPSQPRRPQVVITCSIIFTDYIGPVEISAPEVLASLQPGIPALLIKGALGSSYILSTPRRTSVIAAIGRGHLGR